MLEELVGGRVEAVPRALEVGLVCKVEAVQRFRHRLPQRRCGALALVCELLSFSRADLVGEARARMLHDPDDAHGVCRGLAPPRRPASFACHSQERPLKAKQTQRRPTNRRITHWVVGQQPNAPSIPWIHGSQQCSVQCSTGRSKNALTHSLTHSLTRSLARSLTHCTHTHTHPPARWLAGLCPDYLTRKCLISSLTMSVSLRASLNVDRP